MRAMCLQAGQFLVPGFIDLHVHAMQYTYTGTGTDLPLMQWLQQYAFPREAAYNLQDRCRAESELAAVLSRLLSYGTTTALYFASLDLEPSCMLASLASTAGNDQWPLQPGRQVMSTGLSTGTHNGETTLPASPFVCLRLPHACARVRMCMCGEVRGSADIHLHARAHRWLLRSPLSGHESRTLLGIALFEGKLLASALCTYSIHPKRTIRRGLGAARAFSEDYRSNDSSMFPLMRPWNAHRGGLAGTAAGGGGSCVFSCPKFLPVSLHSFRGEGV